ncbi:MAG: putative F0F1-ATPase subunit Ca2+/Mg2+ transporter [Candidatus Binatota bacterium]|nr:putative F0F1-ATPase subunit Ca2+/Mg2+ transporter [Candidatus Binatota bacterium]
MTDPPEDPHRRRNPWVAIGELTAVAFEFTGGIAAGAAGGYFADRWLGTEPWLLIGGTLFGTGAGFFRMIQMLRHFQRSQS